MGLDMYLEGHKYHSRSGGKKRPTCKDGHEIQSTTLDLGYWRKHPNLHGYIVNTYANGVDECQAIQLNAKELEDIADAIETNRLPHTEGFFFGTSEWHQETVKEDAQKFRNASEWLKGNDVWCDVRYQASWQKLRQI